MSDRTIVFQFWRNCANTWPFTISSRWSKQLFRTADAPAAMVANDGRLKVWVSCRKELVYKLATTPLNKPCKHTSLHQYMAAVFTQATLPQAPGPGPITGVPGTWLRKLISSKSGSLKANPHSFCRIQQRTLVNGKERSRFLFFDSPWGVSEKLKSVFQFGLTADKWVATSWTVPVTLVLGPPGYDSTSQTKSVIVYPEIGGSGVGMACA